MPSDTFAAEMTPEECRLEDLKQMAAYAGPIVSFDVAEPYYLASCDHCGWVGSSELCWTDSWGDDSDVYCPRCRSSGADCGKVASRLTPTDTDTAIPAGECHECGGNGYDGGRIPEQEEFQGEYDFACYPCGGTGKAAASPKPDTDTPVDPGVEGVREIVRRTVWSNTGCSDDAADRAADAIIAALAAKPIAGMDAGEVGERCEDCGLLLKECNALAIARIEAEKYLRECEGYEWDDAHATVSRLLPHPLATSQEDGK